MVTSKDILCVQISGAHIIFSASYMRNISKNNMVWRRSSVLMCVADGELISPTPRWGFHRGKMSSDSYCSRSKFLKWAKHDTSRVRSALWALASSTVMGTRFSSPKGLQSSPYQSAVSTKPGSSHTKTPFNMPLCFFIGSSYLTRTRNSVTSLTALVGWYTVSTNHTASSGLVLMHIPDKIPGGYWDFGVGFMASLRWVSCSGGICNHTLCPKFMEN